MLISDWSSDVCSSDLIVAGLGRAGDRAPVEIDLVDPPVILGSPVAGAADAVEAVRNPVLLRVHALGDVLAGDAAVLGGPLHRLAHEEHAAGAERIGQRAIGLALRV